MTSDASYQAVLDSFPEIYRNLLPEFFFKAIPKEELATCQDCAMCAKPGVASAAELGSAFFNSATKCCTFHPAVPNFLVGGILLDPTTGMEEGRQRIRERIRNRVDCWPTGLMVPPVYHHLYKSMHVNVFGGSTAMRCPYFREGEFNCTIWKHRNSTCSTWFCKHVKGEDGRTFWNSVKEYVDQLEWMLPAYFLLQLGLKPQETAKLGSGQGLTKQQIDGVVDEKKHAEVWGEWRGKEEAFYIECAQLAGKLTRVDVERIAGTYHDLKRLPRLEEAYRNMIDPIVPDPLLRNPNLTVFPRADGNRFVTSVAGSFTISADVLDMLWVFDGTRSTTQAAALVEQRHGALLSQALLTKFYQNRILIAADGPR